MTMAQNEGARSTSHPPQQFKGRLMRFVASEAFAMSDKSEFREIQAAC
jgi:hypothetical protein